jgi:hypothetical protein
MTIVDKLLLMNINVREYKLLSFVLILITTVGLNIQYSNAESKEIH